MKHSYRILKSSGILIIILLLWISSYPLIMANKYESTSFQGPFIDQIVSSTYANISDEVYALLNDELDLIGESLDPHVLEELHEAQNIGVTNHSQNSYTFFLFNCAKYPLNLTVLRQAIAFAFDKDKVITEIWNGYAEPLDSPVPRINPFCAEDLLPYHFYEGKIEDANSMLDEAGFGINQSTGFRMAPDGEPLNLLIEVPFSSEPQLLVGEFMEETMLLLHINATCQSIDPYELSSEGAWNNYDIRLLENRFTNMDVNWMGHDFWHDTIRHPSIGLAGFDNETYDLLGIQLLNSTNSDDAFQIAFEMQKLLVTECPIIVAYERKYISAFRTDRFQGFPASIQMGTSSWWTNYLAQLKASTGGPFGGTLRISESTIIDTFNFLTTTSHQAQNLLQMCYDSLIRQDRYGNDILWLSSGYSVATHSDNATIPDGHERFVFDLITNATWTDGQPLTAEDVAFSLKYYRDAPSSPFAECLSGLSDAYASSRYTCVVEFNRESYWNLHAVAYRQILPEHIFSDIGMNGWNTWNPYPGDESLVTSGPFKITGYTVDELCELTWNPNFFFSYNRTLPTTTTQFTDPMELFVIAGGAGVLVVIIGGVYVLSRRGSPSI